MSAALAAQCAPAMAANCTSVVTGGNWSAVTTWTGCIGGNGVPANTPGPGDNVTITGTVAPVIVNVNAAAATLTFAAGGANATLTHAGANSLTVGDVAMNAPSGNNSGFWNINAGSAIVNGNVTINGGVNDNRRNHIIITTGTLTIGGNLSMVAGTAPRAQINMSGGAGTLNLAGAFTINSAGTLAAGGTSTFNFNGAIAQTIPVGVSAVVYNNVHVNNTSAAGATLGAAVTAASVTGSLRVQSGLLTNGGFAIAGGATDSFVVANAATFRMTGTAAFPTGYGTYSLGPTSTVQYRQTNAQTVPAHTYGHLEITPAGNAVTHTFGPGTTVVAGNLSVGNGTNTAVMVTAASNNSTLNVAGSVSIAANTGFSGHSTNLFTIGGDWSLAGTFTHNNGTVTFNGTGPQFINGVTTFGNVTIANASAPVTANAAHTVAGTLTLNANTQLNDGGQVIGVNGGIVNLGVHSGIGYIELNGGGAAHQLSGSGTYQNLRMNDALGAVLTGSPVVSAQLTLSSGHITTGGNTLTIGPAGSVSGGGPASHVVGNLAKTFAGNGAFTYDVGDGTNHTPLIANCSVPTPGTLTATVGNADHPDTTAGTSGLDSSRGINRYWTLKNPTLTASCSVTFRYINGIPVDRDPGATSTAFVVRRGAACAGAGLGRSCPTWSFAALASTPTSTEAAVAGVEIAAGGSDADFAVGEGVLSNFVREKQFIYSRELY